MHERKGGGQAPKNGLLSRWLSPLFSLQALNEERDISALKAFLFYSLFLAKKCFQVKKSLGDAIL